MEFTANILICTVFVMDTSGLLILAIYIFFIYMDVDIVNKPLLCTYCFFSLLIVISLMRLVLYPRRPNSIHYFVLTSTACFKLPSFAIFLVIISSV